MNVTSEKIYRDIIKIDEEKCTGCGICANGCPEGALKVIDGKARLVGEILCDGLGACMKDCPEDAIRVERRQADPYDELLVLKNVISHGDNVIKAHLEHLLHHGQDEYYTIATEYLEKEGIPIPEIDLEEDHQMVDSGCPGSRIIELQTSAKDEGELGEGFVLPSQLRNWPVQLKLINPNASYFDGAELLIAADCTPFAFANFHQEFLKGKTTIMFCPKLDGAYLDEYMAKLTQIFKRHDIKSVTMVHMQVPCCFGLHSLVDDAIKQSGNKLPIKDYIVSIKGEVSERNPHLKFH